jgi:hypothetical protein
LNVSVLFLNVFERFLHELARLMRKSALLIEILTLLRINLRVWFYPILPNLPKMVSEPVLSKACGERSRTVERVEPIPQIPQKAMNFLPNFGDFVLSTSLDSNGKKQEIFVNNRRYQNGHNTLKTALLAESKIAPRGFEPLLPG